MDVGELEKMTSKLNQGKIERLPSNDSLREDQGSRSEISQMEVTFDTYHDSCQEKTIVFAFLCKKGRGINLQTKVSWDFCRHRLSPIFWNFVFPFWTKKALFLSPPKSSQ